MFYSESLVIHKCITLYFVLENLNKKHEQGQFKQHIICHELTDPLFNLRFNTSTSGNIGEHYSWYGSD